MRKRRIKASPSYINALSFFSTATSLEELDEQFVKLKRSDNSENTVFFIGEAYNQQKNFKNYKKQLRDFAFGAAIQAGV